MVTIEQILKQAKEMGVSDIHITVGLPPRVRLNGALINLPYPKLTPEDTEKIITPIMKESDLETYKKLGQVDLAYSSSEAGRYRVNVFRQRGSMACALRTVNTVIPAPEVLGVPESVIDLWNRKRGLVVVTGPTGSGKSTTLASIIDMINERRDAHIVTLEDPIEYMHTHKKSMINQREVGDDTDSYASALRAVLREDPDVILVGEMRDLETIATAITAAETGHLVFSTLHTIGAAATIDRIIDVFPTHQQQQIRIQLGMVLEAVISQQLIQRVDRPGRVAAFEVMHATIPVRNLIREGKTYQIASTMQTSKDKGMITMDDALLDLYRQGYISADDTVSYAQDMTYVAKRIGYTGLSTGYNTVGYNEGYNGGGYNNYSGGMDMVPMGGNNYNNYNNM